MVDVKVKALEKLLDYAASGIGAVAGPMLAEWKARKEAEAKLITAQVDADVQTIKAQADAKSLLIIADAQAEARRFLHTPIESASATLDISRDSIQQRIEFQERKQQVNTISVVYDAAAGLGDKEVPDHEHRPRTIGLLASSIVFRTFRLRTCKRFGRKFFPAK